MSPVTTSRPRVRSLLLWAAPLVWLGCGGGGGTDVVLPSLSVTTSTEGVELDSDGYGLVVDGAQPQTIGTAATLVIEGLSDGEHTVELSGLAANCSAQGENPRSVTIRSGATSSVEFTVTCTASSGTIAVTTATTGPGSDPDGFTVMLDGSEHGTIGTSATVSLTGVQPGDHMLGLTGLAGNCQLAGENPRRVPVALGQTAQVSLTVSCDAPAPSTGTLEITTATSGSNQDPDGYSVSVDGGATQPIGVNDAVALSSMSAEQHTIELIGVATNCSVAGTNPRQATVAAGATSRVAFAISCATPPPGTGSAQITAVTTGSSLDPDGYTVRIDNSNPQSLTVNGSVTVGNLTAGTHSIRLGGVADNCEVSGGNPRSVTITGGQTSPVAFTVTCVTPPPATGRLRITAGTSGSSLDPDGYTVSVDGESAQALGINGSRTIDGLAVGAHSVQLAGLAGNCALAGENPRTVTVSAEQTAAVSFQITCAALPPTTGSLRVTAATTGSALDADGYAVRVDGGDARPLTINGSRTFENLSPAAHSVQLSGLAANCSVSGDNPRSVTVTAGQSASTTFAVTCVATGPSINLRIERLYITQSTQTLSGDVPLVQGRDGYLRVFVTASASNSVSPSVRVQFFQNGSSNPVETLTISGPGSSTPTAVQEGTLGSSWNVRVPASVIQPNTRILAEVDPGDAVAETNEADNRFPASGTPQTMNVRAVPPVSIQFVPIRQTSNGLEGSVGNTTTLVDFARRIYPLNQIQAEVHPVVLTSTVLTNSSSSWLTVLDELDVVRIVEGTGDNYFGLVRLGYSAGMNGIGYVGVPTAVGSDEPSNVSRVIAHELGHNWGRWHSPCGTGAGLDPNEPYPYPNGEIGVYGFDVRAASLKPRTDPDIMGYCPDPWISDWTFRKVLAFRDASSFATASTLAQKQPSVIVWGHIANGRVMLEPAFQVVTRPNLPKAPGPYSVEATASDGTRLFSLTFAPLQVADTPEGGGHFAFAVPLTQAAAARLSSLRLTGPSGAVSAASSSTAQLQRAAASDSIVARREGESVTLNWNASVHPMIVVRDPDSGQVLSLARGGNAQVWTGKNAVDLEVSDGLRSHRVRRAISRP